ncbi:MAG TPA: 30S ribosomal protein S20 [Gemmatimonadales bacterium]|nr:30S ribosomal protein S20 [Gemmatimonadales bacterium]
MPRIKSAKKRQRQAKARTARNREQRSALRTAVRKVRRAATRAEAEQALAQATQLLDRAGRKRLVHPNLASRTKHRLAKDVAAKQ